MSPTSAPGSGDIARALAAITKVEKRDGNLVRRVGIRPEHDCYDVCAFSSPTCKKGQGGWHGIGSRGIRWSVAVLGVGAVSLEMSTPIFTEKALLRGGPSLASLIDRWEPLGPLDLHYGTAPDYLSEYAPKDCDLIDGKCWGDVTYMQADNAFAAYQQGGTPAVWSWLAEAWLPDVLHNGGSKHVDSGLLCDVVDCNELAVTGVSGESGDLLVCRAHASDIGGPGGES